MKTIPYFVITLLLFTSCKQEKQQTDQKSADQYIVDTTLPWSQRMANTVMHDYPSLWMMEDRDEPSWRYTYGLVGIAMQRVWKKTNNEEYFDYVKNYVDDIVDSTGNINGYKMSDYNIDKINSGNVLFPLYDKTGDEKYKNAIDTLRKQLKMHPRTSVGGFWHKKRYPNQMWLDGLYMGGPFYVCYGKKFNEPQNFDDVANWIIMMEEKARDKETGLLYHAWDESREQKWADPETGLSPNFWGRGMGWYGMALVEVLECFPADHPQRQEIIEICQRFAEAIIKVQDETGCWYQVLDQGNREGNYLEGSATAMFTYFLLKAAQKGYINESYLDHANKAYNGMIKELIHVGEDGRVVISPVCAVAGLGGDPFRDGSFEYYINEKQRDNDPKAVGPFIFASLIFEEIKK